jgi:LysM repeat protein
MRQITTLTLLMATFVCFQGHSQTKNPSYEAYINKYKDIAIQQQKLYKIPASITLAQGLLETGAGSSRLARVGNNHFGIKCKEEWTGGRMYHDDDAKNECFRTYKSAEDSYLDHSLFLAKRKYYVSLFDLNIYDYKGWAHGLQKCGYATDKLYGQKLVNIIETYELYKYDKTQPVTKKQINDDIYEIKLDVSEFEIKHPDYTKWRRNIYQVNGIHYIKAQANESYKTISDDIHMKLKKLYKYNEVSDAYKLSKGDNIFVQPKKKQAAKGNSVHVVKPGESVYSVSQTHGVKIKSLYKFNKLSDDYIPKTGDVLKIRK